MLDGVGLFFGVNVLEYGGVYDLYFRLWCRNDSGDVPSFGEEQGVRDCCPAPHRQFPYG